MELHREACEVGLLFIIGLYDLGVLAQGHFIDLRMTLLVIIKKICIIRSLFGTNTKYIVFPDYFGHGQIVQCGTKNYE